MRPVCSWLLYEVVILSDGTVTTCCHDARGQNGFANIYEHDAHEVTARYAAFRQRFFEKPEEVPLCARCVKGMARTGVGTLDATDVEAREFLDPNHFPPNLVIELSSLCNLACNGCIQSTGELSKCRTGSDGRFLRVPVLERWLLPIIKDLRLIRLYNYGETFLHPKAVPFCAFVREQSPKTEVHIASNGLLLDNAEMADEVVRAQPTVVDFSIHGASQETLRKYMGTRANFDKAVANMRLLLDARSRAKSLLPHVGWKCVLFEWNDSDDEMDRIRSMSKEIGVDLYGFDLASGEHASKRFASGSQDWKELVARKEWYFDVFWQFLRPNVLENLRCLAG